MAGDRAGYGQRTGGVKAVRGCPTAEANAHSQEEMAMASAENTRYRTRWLLVPLLVDHSTTHKRRVPVGCVRYAGHHVVRRCCLQPVRVRFGVVRWVRQHHRNAVARSGGSAGCIAATCKAAINLHHLRSEKHWTGKIERHGAIRNTATRDAGFEFCLRC